MLSNPYTIAIAIPLILIFSGGLARKIVRGTSFELKDFYLGVELALGALGTCLTNFFDMSKLATQGQISVAAESLTKNATFLAINFFLLLVILATHQEWERRIQNVNAQVLWLGLFANGIGASLMIAFILFVKGV